MGADGGRVAALGLRERRLGEEGVARLGRACVQEQARADGASGADGAQAPRRHPERSGAAGDEREDPADQGDGLRVPTP